MSGPAVDEELLERAALRTAQSWEAIGSDYPLIAQAMLRHRTTRMGPMSFIGNPSLVEMYADFDKIDGADVCKATQTGLSELVIQILLESSGWRAKIAAVVLPTFSIRDRFVQSRVDPLLKEVPEYRMRSGGRLDGKGKKGAENLKLKRFGDGSLMFLGSNSATDFVEFSCDILVVDEYDQCDPGNLAKARDRLRNSPYPQLFRVGNPAIPRQGIAGLYDAGDGRLFHWRCSHCNERQPIDWLRNVVRETDAGQWVPRDAERARRLLESGGKGPDIRPVCRRCDQPFERDAASAAWVAARPGRRRSYRMSRLDVLNDRIWKLYAEEWIPAQGSRVKMGAFFGGVLGLPYEDAAAKLSTGMLEATCTGADNDWNGGQPYEEELVVMGVDVGTVLNVVVDVIHLDEEDQTYRRSALICAVPSFEAIKDIIKRYRVNVVVIDARPETRKATELRDWALDNRAETTVWLAQFHPTDRVGSDEYGLRVDYVSSVLTADRTQLLDATYDEIANGRRVFPRDAFSVPEWAAQMIAPVRMLDPKKGRRFIWSEGSQDDHYRLADAYARMAADQAQGSGGFIG